MKISQFSWRKAFPEDLPRIHDIIEQAKQQMLREGKQQWNEYYPALTDLQEDASPNMEPTCKEVSVQNMDMYFVRKTDCR